MPRDDALETNGRVRANQVTSGGLDLDCQGTWMGERRRRRGRAAGNAAAGVHFGRYAGVHAAGGVGLVSHCQQARMYANSTLFSLRSAGELGLLAGW